MAEPRPGEWRRGWRVLAASGLSLGCGANLHYYVSTFFVAGITAEFAISRGQLASIQAMALWGVLAAPAAGYLVDRFGARRVLTLGAATLGGVYLFAANMPARLWALFLAFLAIQALGQATATVPHTRVISTWFKQNRGAALGIAITGTPLLAALVPPALAALIAAGGWRTGYYLLAGLALLIALPLNRLVVRERHVSDNEVEGTGATKPFAGADLRTAVRTRPFWLLIAAMVLINVPGGGFLNQLVPLLTDAGVTAGTAALMVSIFSFSVIAGRLASGFLLDRVSPALAAAGFTLAPAGGMAILLLSPTPEITSVGLGVALIGLQQGAEIDLLAFFIARHFGLRRYSSIYAVGYAVATIATSFGLLAFGVSHDLTGGYGAALAFSILTFLLGAACFAALQAQPVHQE